MKTCAFADCGRELYSHNLCRAHYIQRRKGKALTPLRPYNKVKGNKKRCTRCDEVKTLDEYTVRSTGYPLPTCKPCTAALEMAAYYAKKKNVAQSATTITGGSESDV